MRVRAALFVTLVGCGHVADAVDDASTNDAEASCGPMEGPVDPTRCSAPRSSACLAWKSVTAGDLAIDTLHFHEVFVRGHDDVWFRASDATATTIKIVHFDGSAWSAVDVPVDVTRAPLLGASLWVDGSGTLWLTTFGRLSSFEGGAWSPWPGLIATEGVDLSWFGHDVAWIHGTSVESVDGGTIARPFLLRWTGADWERTTSPDDPPRPPHFWHPFVITASSSDDVWLGVQDSPTTATVHHGDGHTWSSTPAPPLPMDGDGGLRGGQAGIALSATDVWLAGDSYRAEMLHFDGASWATSTLEGAKLMQSTSMWAASCADIWAVGSGALAADGSGEGALSAHWDGVRWTAIALPLLEAQSVSGSSSDDVWAVGYGGVVHYGSP